MESATDPDPTVWEPTTTVSGGKTYRCLVCEDLRPRERHRLSEHEGRGVHLDALKRHKSSPPPTSSATQTNELPLSAFVTDGIQALLTLLSAPAGPFDETPAADWPEPPSPTRPAPRIIDWGLSDNTELDPSPQARAAGQIAQQLLQFQRMDAGSDDEMQERSDEEDDIDDLQEPTVTVNNGDDEDSGHREKRARNRDHTQYSRQWYPWTDRIDTTVLSGINTYVNSLGQILSQEMSNPKVRPHLDFYPEDTGKLLAEARQGKRWLEEIPSSQTTPMARIGKQDYFIHEPAMLDDGKFCVPIRWFVRDKVLVAKCWDLVVITTETGQNWRVIQSESEVSQARFLKSFPKLKADISFYNFPNPSKIKDMQDPLSGALSPWDLTDPVIGNPWRERAKGARVLAFSIWLYCDDTSGNLSKKWNEHNSFLFTPAGLPREESQKEYNVHFLCTSNIAPPLEMLDGILDQLESGQKDGIWAWDSELHELVLIIPSVLALLGDNPMQSEFACHIGLRGKYFCRACWVKGSDSLDDQDATAARSKDSASPNASDSESQAATDTDSDAGSDIDSAPRNESLPNAPLTSATATQTPNPSPAPIPEVPTEVTETNVNDINTDPIPIPHSATPDAAEQPKKSRGRRAKETLEQTILRVKSFVKIGKLRTKEETTKELRTYFDEAATLNTKTKSKTCRGKEERQAALDAQRQKLPKDITSPVWRIQGLDPHHDTPVEILHVVLLGFVKYMWRDLVQNQLQTKDDVKSLLETRLNSFDVSGLGISPLAGHTLVQYSGSLVGRDFRTIAQAAPFVVYDLVSKDCLATWVALSKLIPLIWQPSIKDIDAHIALLTAEINHFLVCAARWTTRWFNKPKFHILLHLPAHIRRFGPAILFATEAFESFNAIIRAKSVHSNRHAPSRDIARAFAQGNRIRHLLSGGLFMQPSLVDAALTPSSTTPSNNAANPSPIPATKPSRLELIANRKLSRKEKDWAHAGPGPLSLVSLPNTVTQYLGLDGKKKGTHGICVCDKQPARLFSATLAGSKLPHSLRDNPVQPALLKTSSDVYLDNAGVYGDFMYKRPVV
ncbi:hypothetical protein B0H14DRAFT_2578514 [Mycena olivaceomarginata]|nr:hypothetical protein B0H14DRAFT_2578514 [Mycena olivaceomarginata]